MKLSKKDFYPKSGLALTAHGYTYFDGDKSIKGKTSAHARRPDYVAVKGDMIVIGEIKSPSEPPTSYNWRQAQPGDSKNMVRVRARVLAKEKAGELDRKVGGHEIIIRGQIVEYAGSMGVTYEMPVDIAGKKIMGGYTVDSDQVGDVEKALRRCRRRIVEKIDDGNGSVTYVFAL